MAKRPKTTESAKLLTDAELELMTILWKLGEGTVAEVMAELPKDLAYTSVSTILRILEQKGVLKARKEGRGHIYIPLVEKSAYEAKTVKHIVNRVFDGTPTALVRQLVNTVELTPAQLTELKKIIEEAGGKK